MLSHLTIILAAVASTAPPVAPDPPHARHTQDRIPVDRAFLSSHPWAPAGRCAEKLTFRDDGTVDPVEGILRWRLDGSILTLSREGDPDIVVAVERRGNDIVMSMEGASTVISECPDGD